MPCQESHEKCQSKDSMRAAATCTGETVAAAFGDGDAVTGLRQGTCLRGFADGYTRPRRVCIMVLNRPGPLHRKKPWPVA